MMSSGWVREPRRNEPLRRLLARLSVACLLCSALACSTAPKQPHVSSVSGSAGAGDVATALDPGRKDMHRLNSTEYNATVQDVLGTTLQPADGSWRGGELGGFDNIASVLGVDAAQYERYYNAGHALATELLASDQLQAHFVSCDTADATCARLVVAAVGPRLFRRPLAEDELDTYQRVYIAARGLGVDETTALTLTMQALLSSAEFLYRIELDPDPASTEPHPLDAFELASRLSYFLWSSAPDQALLQAATDGSLTEPTTLSAVIDRMLDDPKSQRLVTSFAGQWLGAREVPSHPAMPQFYQWTPSVALSAAQEMLLYFGDFFQSDRSWFEFPTADFNYIDAGLAPLYGIPTTLSGSGNFERVEYRDDQRAGFFGLAGFLALSSLDRRTSPSRRGHWIAGNLLCDEPPPPPPVVPMLDSESAGGAAATLDVRQVLEMHRANPSCASCHSLFDPYGLALEKYNAVGVYRSTYDDGTPVDASSMLPPSAGQSQGQMVEGLDGLSRAVATDPRFGECVAKKLLTYGLGRQLTTSDEPYLQQAQAQWLATGQTPSLRRLVHALISSDAFRSRRGGD